MYMAKKRGQTGGGAAGLVAIIAGLIILYILFLEPAERADLLGDEDDDNGNGDSDDEEVTVLLDEEPGRLDYLKGDDFEIDIPSFKLYKTTNAKEIEVFNDFSVRKGWFDEKIVEKSFFIDNLENSDNIILSFSVRKHSGVLSVDLNGNNIYESLITTQNVEPIKLRKQYLNDESNTLKFSVSGVGLAFWSTNEYNFDGVKIIGDITDVSRQKTKNIFTIEPWKYNNLEKSTLKFHPDCRQRLSTR